MKIKSVKSSQEFALEIERIVQDTKTDYFDAILYYMEKNNLEADVVAALVRDNQVLKAKLYNECMRLNLVEKISVLPL